MENYLVYDDIISALYLHTQRDGHKLVEFKVKDDDIYSIFYLCFLKQYKTIIQMDYVVEGDFKTLFFLLRNGYISLKDIKCFSSLKNNPYLKKINPTSYLVDFASFIGYHESPSFENMLIKIFEAYYKRRKD